MAGRPKFELCKGCKTKRKCTREKKCAAKGKPGKRGIYNY